MIKNSQKNGNQLQHKSQPVSDDQSCQIRVEHVNKQMTTHTDFDIKYEEDDKQILMFIQLDPKNILNLTKQANRNKTYQDERKYFKNSIFVRKIQTPQTHFKGNFRISYVHYKGLTLTIQLMQNKQNSDEMRQQDDIQNLYTRMKLHYKTQQNWQTKWINCDQVQQKQSKVYNFQINASEVEKILRQKLLLQIFFEKVQKISKDYAGIQNQGNTCYANSTLQLLYHFIPLRKMIVQLPSKKLKKLTKSLQQIFVDLMTSSTSVRAESLLQCFQKIDSSYPHRQQDIHQFLISFFDELQRQLPEVAGFWTGKDYEVTYSKQAKYETKQQQNFTQLQLLMSDTKGTYFHSITDSLFQLLQQDRADQPIDTDQFGKIQVYKNRFFESMPPLLFMNIKRYQYNAKRKQLNKINLDLTYPKGINLDFLMKTKQGLDYVLYAIVVHKGRTPYSGHYFCFVNVSKQWDKPNWYQFNDSIVRKAKQEKVLNKFTGKKKWQIFLNQQYGKWAQRQQPSQETAYLLVYINKDNFEQYQNLQAKIPTWQVQRLQQKLTEQQYKTMIAVKLFVLSSDQQFRPFQQSLQILQQMKLSKDKLLQQQLIRLQKQLSCKVGTVWKVNCKTRTIKHIHKDYGQQCRITVGRHTQFKRGIRQPDYFIIIPQQKMSKIQDYQRQKLGILHIEHVSQNQTKDTVQILAKQNINERLEQLKKSGMNLEYNKEDMEYFVYGWNDYLFVRKS